MAGDLILDDEKKAMLERLPQPLSVYRQTDGRIVPVALSAGFLEMFGYRDRESAYRDLRSELYRFIHPHDAARLSKAVQRFVSGEEGLDIVYRSESRDGSGYRMIHATGRHIYPEGETRVAFIWYTDEGPYIEETTDPKGSFRRMMNDALHEESLLRASRYDPLTGLPGMTHFFVLAEEGKRVLQKQGQHAALLFFDLNGMKFFNTKHGFSEGDKLLKSFAVLLVQTFGDENCCHMGADHFAAYTKEDGVEDVLGRFFRECSEINNGNTLPVRVGIYTTSVEDVPVSVACDRAKFACDTSKKTYSSGFQRFSRSMRDDAVRRQYILSHLDQAIREKWIRVYYQPIVRSVNGRVCDEEALARWDDPVMGLLSPAEFIPFLEEAGLIYKLDLYVVSRVLEKICRQKDAGLFVVPQSVNLSRSDFSSCDIVEEIRKRVDNAGVPRALITIEITESTLGSGIDFMKEQVCRFRALGFKVWLDDFGSEYSSLDVLQSIPFDLLKFDMRFVRMLDENKKARIVLTQLMRLAHALDMDTVCEGVETKEQVAFLQEIGCSKLQGYYYSKPIPLQEILERYRKGIQIGFENPEEAEYYESIGRVNLFDLTVMSDEQDSPVQTASQVLPMGVMEIEKGSVRFVRSNQHYRDFIRRFLGMDLSDNTAHFADVEEGPGSLFIRHVRRSCESTNLAFFDEQMEDGTNIHSLIRRIAVNPVTGKVAVAVSVLSITEPDEGTTYAGIARALAADYYNIYYVDLETDRFIEYRSPVGGEELAMEQHGEHFFEAVKRDAMTRIYEEDRGPFLSRFSKEGIVRELDAQGVYTATYRLIDSGEPVYVNMKITRMLPDEKRIIIGISIIDSQMKHREELERIRLEETAYARVMALSGDYLCLYTVDPVTGRFDEYGATEEYKSLGLARTGEDFFTQGAVDGGRVICPEDLPMYLEEFRKENILRRIRESRLFQIHYRLLIGGGRTPVSLKIVSVREKGGEKLIAGVRAWKERKEK